MLLLRPEFNFSCFKFGDFIREAGFHIDIWSCPTNLCVLVSLFVKLDSALTIGAVQILCVQVSLSETGVVSLF